MGSYGGPIVVQNNLAKQSVYELESAPRPAPGILLQIRTGKVGRLGHTKSAIAKREITGPIFVGSTGLIEDEHVYHDHGGIERAVHGYNPNHYADWRSEEPPNPALFDLGGFGENLSATNLDEENVCIGDLYRIGENVVLQVSEPRNPCYKLNIRFEWPRALKRIQSTGRVGWLFRVLQTGYIKRGDSIVLIDRPHPRWSVMNVQRVIAGKSVPLPLLEECSDLEVLTDKFRNRARKRLEGAPRSYTLVEVKVITSRVKQFTFALRDPLKLKNAEFEPFAFAQIRFGPDLCMSRSYSIVFGNLQKFTLGVALDDESRGGSKFLHADLKLGDEIEMLPGANPRAAEDEKTCLEKERSRIASWLLVASAPEQAAFLDMLPTDRTTVYAKTLGERLDITKVIAAKAHNGRFDTKVYCCGPSNLMEACRQHLAEAEHPEHMSHFEDFGNAPSGNLGDPFEVEVHEPDEGRKETLQVPSEKSLLQVLNEAGFDVMYSCQSGGCGACKVTVCAGEVKHRSTVLTAKEKPTNLQACVDRGIGKIKIEID
ncbi:Protein YiiM [Pseudocercospora fuligena]|uniref:Protein YiiM n=1 Tax=Pseudocercospora fuligena TaxID=685502 RepID=A0A8H6RNI5_9PEZI|nr:Protein YiiM [Pseudocercospora fuligena]